METPSLELKYFVLKPKAKGNDDMWARASQEAIKTFSDYIRASEPLFADQLLFWAEKEKSKQDYMGFGNKEEL